MLYTPFRSEEELENRVKIAALDGYKTLEKQIQAVKAQVMDHLESNQEARYMAEEASSKLKETGDLLDPQGEQDIEDCLLDDLQLHPDYEHLNPNELKDFESTKHDKTYRPIEVESMNVLNEKTKNLDFYQRLCVHRGIEFARKVVKSRNPKNAYPDGKHVIVHGGAGSGKTAVINILKQWCHFLF